MSLSAIGPASCYEAPAGLHLDAMGDPALT
jgi:hypothetical protein